jgi:phage tail sheath protein FI
MPTAPTYPGVYIEEIPSGVRTITGVSTSITAFIGRTLRGPTDEPITINSFGEFERVFGGLWNGSAMSFAVRDFFRNGGSQALIVRLYNPETGGDAKPDKASLSYDTLNLEASNPGSWGNKLRIRIDHDTRNLEPDEVADSLFNLFVRDNGKGEIEVFRNVSITEGHPRQVDKVLLNESNLVKMSSGLPVPLPQPGHPPPQPGEDIWGDNPIETNSKVPEAFHSSDGLALDINNFTGPGMETNKEGLYSLQKADLFNLLCIPPYLSDYNVDSDLIGTASTYCGNRRAFLLIDPRDDWSNKEAAKNGVSTIGTKSKNAALFFPHLKQRNPLKDNQLERFVPCGAVAGVFARTDAQRGVWKAPAGLEASLAGMPQLRVPLTDQENGELNPLGINCIRVMPAIGPVVWGARTLQGDDRLASEWKYIPVRRLALYIEESLYRGTQWVVFEPNDEPLWSQIRLNIGAFMHNLFRQGAFAGKTPGEAYLVKCDKETTTQNDINLGIVNIIVGFAPLKPAEFVIIKIQQMAGQIET